MIKNTLFALALVAAAASAHAHQLWFERDAAGALRVYVGDADDHHDQGKEVAKLAETTRVFGADAGQPAKLVVKEEYLEVPAIGAGDVRLINEQVWKPWKAKDGTWTTAVFNGREGRTETRAALEYEFVPVVANGNAFTLTFKGAPLAGKTVTVVNADKWTKRVKTDAQGRLEAPVKGAGRYILIAGHSVPEAREVAGQAVTKVDYTTTLSFVAK